MLVVSYEHMNNLKEGARLWMLPTWYGAGRRHEPTLSRFFKSNRAATVRTTTAAAVHRVYKSSIHTYEYVCAVSTRRYSSTYVHAIMFALPRTIENQTQVVEPRSVTQQ